SIPKLRLFPNRCNAVEVNNHPTGAFGLRPETKCPVSIPRRRDGDTSSETIERLIVFRKTLIEVQGFMRDLHGLNQWKSRTFFGIPSHSSAARNKSSSSEE